MPNLLINEKSPYLLQHADNPVEWRPWGEDAFRAALDRDMPIFLSVGYATCHWCHVMAHESFEDEDIARMLNENFVSVKVDREERPDVDNVYMTVCQMLAGSGGWPLSIFMTPRGQPFYAGTYFPKDSGFGRPGFRDVLRQISKAWRTDNSRLVQAGEEIAVAIQPKSKASFGADERHALGEDALRRAYEQLLSLFDGQWGGFGAAPKFPTPHHLTFLLRWHLRRPESRALEMVRKTLDAMRSGGIFDHLGYGFHRYSVDREWLAPHFEKMLYDQALLAMAYTEAFQAASQPAYARTAREIFGYVLRDMTAPEGGFYSAEDADSEGREGLFYVWTPEEIREVLGPGESGLFCRFHGISDAGNFEEGRSIVHAPIPLDAFAGDAAMDAVRLSELLEDSRKKLLAHRAKRVRPMKDDKILTAWNGLMIAALAKGFQALGDSAYGEAARNAADFILAAMRPGKGRLMRRYRHGEVAIPGYADDYAFLVWGLLELYQAVSETKYLEEAISLNNEMLDIFWDHDGGGFFYVGSDGERLILRDKDSYDGAIPSANSVAALNLFRLARITGNAELEARGNRLIEMFSGPVNNYPSAYTQFLNALDFALGPAR